MISCSCSSRSGAAGIVFLRELLFVICDGELCGDLGEHNAGISVPPSSCSGATTKIVFLRVLLFMICEGESQGDLGEERAGTSYMSHSGAAGNDFLLICRLTVFGEEGGEDSPGISLISCSAAAGNDFLRAPRGARGRSPDRLVGERGGVLGKGKSNIPAAEGSSAFHAVFLFCGEPEGVVVADNSSAGLWRVYPLGCIPDVSPEFICSASFCMPLFARLEGEP